MDNRKDPMDQIITEDLLNEAESIDREIANADVDEMPAEVEELIRKRLHAQIDEYERKRIYAQLSEEDQKALKLGQEMLRDKAEESSDKKRVYRRKSKKVYVAVAAVVVLVLAMGVTSIGGAERIAKMMKNVVGNREVVQVDTSDDNYIVVTDKEEEAYQELKDVFGVDPVKIVHWPGEVVFEEAEIDEDLQNALLKYEYNEKTISYFISSHYTESSWGIDIEDKLTEQYYIVNNQNQIKIKEYETPESKTKVYLGSYEYNGLEYTLVGMMEKEEFDFLIKNLNFF